MASDIRKLYIAQCPKCNKPLKEISYVPVYRCGSCNAILLANCWKTVLDRVALGNPETLSPKKNDSFSGDSSNDRVGSGNPESIPPKKNDSFNCDSSNEPIPDSSIATAFCTSDAVVEVLENEADRMIDVDGAKGPFRSRSCHKHIEGHQTDDKESSYVKNVHTFYEKDKESLSQMSSNEHMLRDESDNGTGTANHPLTSLINKKSFSLKDVYAVYNEQHKQLSPPDPVTGSSFDRRVKDEGHNWDGHQVENSFVNSNTSSETSDHIDTLEVQSMCLPNKTAMDIALADVLVYALDVSNPDDKCGIHTYGGTETVNYENLECDSSQNESPKYISNGRIEDKSHHPNAAGLAETSTDKKHEEFSEPSYDTDTSEKVLTEESPSTGTVVNAELTDIQLYASDGIVSSSSYTCRNPTPEESEISNSGSLEWIPYEQHHPECDFDGRKENKGKKLDFDQAETSEYNDQSVGSSAPNYKSEETLDECFSKGIDRDIRSPDIHFDGFNELVSSSVDQYTKCTFGEHESWNTQRPECNQYQQKNPFILLDNSVCSSMMQKTTDNNSTGYSSTGTNFCDRVEADLIDVERTSSSMKNTEGFQEPNIVTQQRLNCNLKTVGLGTTKLVKELTNMYSHEDENSSDPDDSLSASLDDVEISSCLIDDDSHDGGNDGFPTTLLEMVEAGISNTIPLADGSICEASRTATVGYTDGNVKGETIESQISEDVSFPIHESFLEKHKSRLQNKQDIDQCTLVNSNEHSLCLVGGENKNSEIEGEAVNYMYDTNEVEHQCQSVLSDQAYISSSIFDAGSSRLAEAMADSSTSVFIYEEAVCKKADNNEDTEMKVPMNMSSNAEIDMSNDRSDGIQYNLDTMESMFHSVDAAKSRNKQDSTGSGEMYNLFPSEGCIGLDEPRIGLTDNAGFKTSKTDKESRESTNFSVTGNVTVQNLDSASRNMEHSVLMHSNSLQKKASGNEPDIDQHVLSDENTYKESILDATSLAMENLANSMVSPNNLTRLCSFKQDVNDKGDDTDDSGIAPMQFILGSTSSDTKNLGKNLVPPGSTSHFCGIKEYFSGKEEHGSNDNQQFHDSEHINIPFTDGGNGDSGFLLSNIKDMTSENLLSGQSQDVQYTSDMCNHSLQVIPEMEADCVNSTLGNNNKCLPYTLQMNASEKQPNSAYGTLDDSNEDLVNINSHERSEIVPFSDSRRHQMKPGRQAFPEQESLLSEKNILSYGYNNDGPVMKEEQAFPNREAVLCSIAADADDSKFVGYLKKHPSYSSYTLKSEQTIEKIEVSETCGNLDKPVESMDNRPSVIVSHREVKEHRETSINSHISKTKMTDVNDTTTAYASSPIYKSSLDHDNCFYSIDEVYWNDVPNQRRARRTSRPQKNRGSSNKEKNNGDVASTGKEMGSRSKMPALEKTKILSKQRHASLNHHGSLPNNEASWQHPKQQTSGSSGDFYSAKNRTTSESEVPEARSITFAARKLISSQYNSSQHPKSKMSDEKRIEMIRKIDELKNQLVSFHGQTGGYSLTHTGITEGVNCQTTTNRQYLKQEQFQPSPSTSQASNHHAGTLISVEKASQKHMFLQMSTSGKIDFYLNQRQEHIQFVNQISPKSPVSRPERVQKVLSGTGLQVHSEPCSPLPIYATSNQEGRIRKVQQGGYHQERKQHCRPILGGAPFIICSECLEILKLPKDFQIPKKNCKLQCGLCSAVLQFSLTGRTHIVPRTPKRVEVLP